MKYLGTMHYFLGLEVWQFHDEIFLNQGKYIVDILNRFGMLDCKSITTSMVTKLKLLNDDSSERVDVTLYKEIIGALMYLTNTRLDICFVVNTLIQYMMDLRHVHLVAEKHVMRYLKGTFDCSLRYVVDSEFKLYGFTNSYWEV